MLRPPRPRVFTLACVLTVMEADVAAKAVSTESEPSESFATDPSAASLKEVTSL